MLIRPQTRTAEAAGHLAPLLQGARLWRYRMLCALWALAALWFWSWWLDPAHLIAPGRFALITAALIWLSAMQGYFLIVMMQARKPVSPDPERGRFRVAMIVTKTPSEPFSVLRPTLEAMLAQDYPHDTWLADEAPDETTREWCAAHNVQISSRAGVAAYHQPVWPRRTRCKEGNLAYFYDNWGYRFYDVVSQLDADHVPQPGYLREMLRPFADPTVGYVSAPSICAANASASWAARARLHAESAFHGMLQAGYTGALTPMCIGSHYAVRTRALRQAGGLGPDLAEDHSTTMLIAAAGWRGVHAIDAIAIGDGPATLPDLITQEFQWSRSLMTLLLAHTPRYLRALPARLRVLFVLCQSWYLIFALVMALIYAMPILALSLGMRFADVTFPAFLGHALPAGLVLLGVAYALRRDALLRPYQAHILGWERMLFPMIQWPWVLWGCVMAIRDRITGGFVDFRITPKGESARARLPGKVLAVYAGLAIGALAPVLLVSEAGEARGFYLLSLFNAVIYTVLLALAIAEPLRRAPGCARRGLAGLRALGLRALGLQVATLSLIGALTVSAMLQRGEESLHALLLGFGPAHLTRVQYVASGAGMGAPGKAKFKLSPGWSNN
ncbi:N-acetylglucosaminyltransferase [Thioclava dalianensis]|uniref:N-acetylglucosaminyltransferase n=1 Tax=Thioclava dalianensis TaxID=1185766 RepID=A0A074TEA5_9RHOB|nr:glycosyltransferase family 2 protein [Thioclava dalianensis]KEP70096.1 N-acetylglucosaminyltransferase [Thioclava dalianensis]SFN51237.1 cellulose synthase (UDP-forming) [Thioclava dalianensis]